MLQTFNRILSSSFSNLLRAATLIILLFLSSCGDVIHPSNRLVVYVNENDEVPAYYHVRIYCDDVLIKSDDFDQEYSGFNNLTEIVNPPSGMYHFYAHSGNLSVRDSLYYVGSAKTKFVHLDLRK